MRVLIHGINYAPEPVGIGRYTAGMAAWLAERGHEVRVVTAPPYYPAWRVAPGYRAWRYRRERVAGVAVWRCPVWVPRRPSGVRRVVHLMSFALSTLPVMLAQARWRPDVVIAVEPPLMCAPGALLTARLAGARSVLHVQDLEVDAGFALGLMPGFLRRPVEAAERRLLMRFDRVTTISRRMRQRLEAKGVAPSACGLLPNWVDIRAVGPPDARSALRAELGIPQDAVVALYAGNMAAKQGLEVVAFAARRHAGRRDLVYVLCGEGPTRDALAWQVADLPNARLLPLQPEARRGDLLRLADIHLLPQRADAADLVMPSKLCGMLASGRPVVASAPVGSELAEVVAGRGLVVPPGDGERFADAVATLADDPTARALLGKEARRYAEEHLARERVLGGLEDMLAALVGGPAQAAPAARARHAG